MVQWRKVWTHCTTFPMPQLLVESYQQLVIIIQGRRVRANFIRTSKGLPERIRFWTVYFRHQGERGTIVFPLSRTIVGTRDTGPYNTDVRSQRIGLASSSGTAKPSCRMGFGAACRVRYTLKPRRLHPLIAGEYVPVRIDLGGIHTC